MDLGERPWGGLIGQFFLANMEAKMWQRCELMIVQNAATFFEVRIDPSR